jgi:chemotaxis response regulator CheB
VIAADPASCAYPEMPRSVLARDDVVDFALPVDEIAAAITGLVEASGRTTTLGVVTGI